jgi:hypothetical protein
MKLTSALWVSVKNQRFHRNEKFDAVLLSKLMQAEFIPKLDQLDTLEEFAKLIHAAEPNITVAYGMPP